jgi:hypothetical protein
VNFRPLTIDQVHFLEFLLGMWRHVRGGLPEPHEVRAALRLEFRARDRILIADILRVKGLIA